MPDCNGLLKETVKENEKGYIKLIFALKKEIRNFQNLTLVKPDYRFPRVKLPF